MKTALSSFDLRALVAEWQSLVGGYIDKVYQRDDEIILRVNVPGHGKAELYFRSGRWLCLHEVEEKPEAPPPFAQVLRRFLENARIVSIEQRDFDRVVVLTAERAGERVEVVYEVFGKGNLVLLREGTTLACLSTQVFRDRAVRPGEPYAFPSGGIDPLELDRAGFAAALRGAKGVVVRALAGVLNLGGPYAEELCLRAAVDKDTKARDLTDAQIDALYTALNNIAVAIDEERRPAVLRKDGRPIDAAPIELLQHAGLEREPFPTFNEALSRYLAISEPEATLADEAVARLERRIAQQEESLRALREEVARYEAQALFLYRHFPLFDELLRTLREGREPPPDPMIKAIDRRAHTVTVGVGDLDAIPLDYEKDVTGNAQALYERRREAQTKARRVEEALAASQRELEGLRTRPALPVPRAKVKPTQPMWFDAYRWALSSEGFFLLGGRDARTNDRLVRKHLKEGDRYAHADLHGAPSVVIKEGSKATEMTLREACEFALAYSKAWPAGLASGSAYWVLPEQVSKQAESGEYLPRGAFVIRGRRNYFHDLPVRLAIGEVEVEEHRKIMAGPVSAVASRSSRYVVLIPGAGDREALAKRLAAAFDVPVEEIARLLPPGPSTVAEARGIAVGTLDLGGASVGGNGKP